VNNLANVKTVQDFIEYLKATYEANGVIPPTAKQMLIMYLPLINLPKKSK